MDPGTWRPLAPPRDERRVPLLPLRPPARARYRRWLLQLVLVGGGGHINRVPLRASLLGAGRARGRRQAQGMAHGRRRRRPMKCAAAGVPRVASV
eukprot:gene21194-biopygen23621